MARYDEQDLDEKRLARRHKRRQSRLIAFIILGIFIALIVALVVFGVSCIKKKFATTSEPAPTQEVTETKEEQEQVIESPSEETQPVQEYSEEDLLTEIVESCIAEMPLEDKVAGLFIATPEQLTGVETAVKAGSGTKDALSSYAVGGIIYAAKNIKSGDQIKEMLETTASMSKYPIFTIMSDKAISNESVIEALGYEIPEELKDAEEAEKAGTDIGTQLYKYGFNLAMAPAIGSSEDGDITAAFARGLKGAGINACEYRFPIMGETLENADSNDATKDDLVRNEYALVKPSIDDGSLGAIQISNISLPQLTGDETPASLSSKVVEEELRGTLGFEGIVITAPLNEAAVIDNYS